jgi:hypothetical protein
MAATVLPVFSFCGGDLAFRVPAFRLLNRGQKRVFKNGLCFALLLLLLPVCGVAGTVYTYTGNPLWDVVGSESLAITATIELSAPLGPNGFLFVDANGSSSGLGCCWAHLSLLDWSISDGIDTITPLTPYMNYGPFGDLDVFAFLADGSGRITTWSMGPYVWDPSTGYDLSLYTGSLWSSIISADGASGPDYSAFNLGNPGVWTLPSGAWVAPEPASIGLTMLGGLALLAIRRKRSS